MDPRTPGGTALRGRYDGLLLLLAAELLCRVGAVCLTLDDLPDTGEAGGFRTASIAALHPLVQETTVTAKVRTPDLYSSCWS